MRGSWLRGAVLTATVALAGCGAGAAAPHGSSAPTATRSGTSASSTAGAPTTPSSTTSSASTAASPARVTLSDNGKTVTLHVGGTFLLALGTQQWTVQIADPTVVARVPNVMVVRGAQGIYRALQPGTTTLEASARPTCPAGVACPLYVLGFRVTLHVLAGSAGGG